MIWNREAFAAVTDGDSEVEKEFLRLFAEEAGRYLEEIKTVVADTEKWRGAMHALKGAAANIRAEDLAECCRQAERASEDARAGAYERVRQEYEKLRPFLPK